MLFETFSDAEATLLWGGFLIALVLGVVVDGPALFGLDEDKPDE